MIEFESNHVLIILLFIIIVYVAYTFYNPSDPFMTSLLGGLGVAFLALLYFCWTDPGIFTNGGEESLSDGAIDDTDTFKYSEYGNISNMYDVQPVSQVERDFPMGGTNADFSLPLDNSAIVQRVLGGGASTYVPLEANSRDYNEVREAAYGGHDGKRSELNYMSYTVPINERAVNLDDKMARKGEHMSSMNKRAIDGAVRTGRNYFQRFFNNELAENEAREWWGEDDGQKETDYEYN